MNGGAILLLLLATAVGFDFYRQQIPNWLVGGGVTLAFLMALLPHYPQLTIPTMIGGLVVGILLFLPLFLWGKMGAGDIKLLGMAGSFLGPVAVCWGALFSLLAGGILAVLWFGFHGLYSGPSSDVEEFDFASERDRRAERSVDATASSSVLASHPRRMPYAAAIAVGCALAYLGFRQ